MPAEQFPILIEKGATYAERFVYQDSTGDPIPMPSWTCTFLVHVIGNPNAAVLTATVANAKAVVNTEPGTVDITFSATDTAAVTAGDYFYILEVSDTASPAVVYRILEGVCEVRAR